MNHEFFEGINWEDLERKKIPSPYKPQLDNIYDVKYFS